MHADAEARAAAEASAAHERHAAELERAAASGANATSVGALALAAELGALEAASAGALVALKHAEEARLSLSSQLADFHERLAILPEFYVKQIFCAVREGGSARGERARGARACSRACACCARARPAVANSAAQPQPPPRRLAACALSPASRSLALPRAPSLHLSAGEEATRPPRRARARGRAGRATQRARGRAGRQAQGGRERKVVELVWEQRRREERRRRRVHCRAGAQRPAR